MKQVQDFQKYFSEALAKERNIISVRTPKNLYDPVIYTLGMGGKRIRPVLVLMAYSLYKEKYADALPAAFAIEVFHNFTLLHDDIMDKASLRRNKNTVHIEYSENAAILSGDAMSILSYEYINQCKKGNFREIVATFTKTALEICEGQQYDMNFETRNDVSVKEYIQMIGYKTAVLIASSLKLGGIIAEAPQKDIDNLYQFGFNLGIAFQLQDDYLDSFGDVETFGKEIGGDILSNKKTFLMITALELAEGKIAEELNNWIALKEFNEKDKIKAVLSIYNQLNLKQKSQQKMTEYYNNAIECWQHLSVNDKTKQELRLLAERLMKRES